MKINTNPIKGTVDYLPAEMELRQYAIDKILKTFKQNGFLQVKTPILENLNLLTSGDSGDNQKLMFKTVKRGEKLNLDKPTLTEADITEEGLRYDLTVPLARLYAGNREKLPMPFKAIQIDESFRAEKPQRGRNRQFTQCDIDIWGDESIFAEAEILIAAMLAYKNIGLDSITLKINDRRALASIIKYVGFKQEDVNKVCISLDKLDKIGKDNVIAEIAKNFNEISGIDNMAGKLLEIISSLQASGNPQELTQYGNMDEIADNLQNLITTIKQFTEVNVVFDITVVRGQGYYTGTVFECYTTTGNFNRAIGGGGRYDKMLEKFVGNSVPAVGYSIGLDPVVMLLKESGKKVCDIKIALIYNKNCTLTEVIIAKNALINKYFKDQPAVSTFLEPKNYKAFFEKLKNCNFTHFVKIDDISVIKEL